MRTMIVAGALLLMACNQSNDAATPTATPTTTAGMATTDAAGAVAANAGTYEMTGTDGMVHTAQLSTNNTYTLTHGGTQAESGTWRAAGTQLCFTPQGGSEACYTGSTPGADGTFTMTGPAGSMLNGATVRKTAAAT